MQHDPAEIRSLEISAAEERKGLVARVTFAAAGRGLRTGAVAAVVVPAALLLAAFVSGSVDARTALGLAEWWYVAGIAGAPMLNCLRLFLLFGTLGAVIAFQGPLARRAAWWGGVAGGGAVLTLLTGVARGVAGWLARFAAEVESFL